MEERRVRDLHFTGFWTPSTWAESPRAEEESLATALQALDRMDAPS
jgi:hypothetical protein